MKGLIHVFLIALFFHSTLQIGTLWVNEIWGNQDTHRVRIEDLVFDDTTMLADFIDGLTNRGIFVEDTQAVDNDMNIPGFLHVFGYATLHGASFFNGGIYADDGDETTTDVWSFSVEDNTGVTTVKGQLRPFGGINADNCLFTVHNITGDTRITSALLRPNGGIEVRNELFTVSDDDGSFRTRGDGIVSLDFIQGNANPQSKLVTRVPAATDFGGNFIIKGQDGVSGGGNLVITPGESNTNGRVLFGRKFADNLYVGRSGLDVVGTNGGETIIGGQNAYNGDGGDFVLLPGSALNVGGSSQSAQARSGGDILLDVGLSTHNGLPGRIILGTDVAGESGFDLVVRRPPALANSDGGDTNFVGQSSTAAANSGFAGGDLYVQAGDLTGGAGSPGDLAIIPGRSNTAQGTIFVGSQTVSRALGDLHIRREDVYTSAGDTVFQGQDTNDGSANTPGALYLMAGDGQSAAGGNGGDIWIMPGTSEKGTPGNIYWGNAAHDLTITRNPAITITAIAATTLQGQTSTQASGGDYNFAAGDGNDAGGLLSIIAGSGTTGGSVSIQAQSGRVNGGSIFINGGFGQEGDGGSVVFSAGSGNPNGGSITLTSGTAGSNTARADIIVGPNAGSLYVDNARVDVQANFITLRSGSNSLVIRGDVATSTLEFNSRTILRDTLPTGIVPAPTGVSIPNAAVNQQTSYAILNALTATVRAIVCALGDPNTAPNAHNSHGLFNIVTTADISTVCDAASF